MTPQTCPACGISLQGKPIGAEHLKFYGTDATHYSRVIAVYDQAQDRTVAWRCPSCEHEWPRV
jgi:hypothetical protein